MDESLFLVRWIIDKIHKNVKKKSLSESLAAIEEAIFKAKQDGNTKNLFALEKIKKYLIKKK